MLAHSIIVLLVHALIAQCSYNAAPPPAPIEYSFPDGDVALHSTLRSGFSGGPYEISSDFYGLGFRVNVSTTMPNGLNVALKAIDSFAQQCTGKASDPRDAPLNTITFVPTVTGRHIAFWSITYRTSGDPKVTNQTFCDAPRLSYQTWIFNASFNVVDPPSSAQASPTYGKIGLALAPQPTRTIFVANGAGSLVPNVVTPILCALLGVASFL